MAGSSASLSFNILARDMTARGFKSAAGGAMKLGKSLQIGIGAGAVAGIGMAISKAADFDKTIRMAGAATGDAGVDLKKFQAVALEMGAKTSFSAKGAADAMLELAKGGTTAADITGGVLQSTLLLAAAGGLELGNAASYMSNAMHLFGLEAKDSASVAAALAGGANASTASVESLGMALSQVGPGAKNAGLSLQETVGALAAFDNAGIKGSDAGTSLKTMLTRLVPQTNKARNAMHDLGLNFVDAHGSFLPLRDVAQQLQDKLGGLTEESKTTALATLFGSDATRAASVLMAEGAAGIDKYVAATSDQAAATNMAKTGTEGAAGAFEKFQGAIETLQISFGLRLLPIVTKFTNWLADKAVPAVANLIDAFASGDGDFATFRETMQTIGAVIMDYVVPAIATFSKFLYEHRTIIKIVGAMAAAFVATLALVAAPAAIAAAVTGALTTAFWALNAAMVANPVGLIVAALVAVGVGVAICYKKFETFRFIVNGVVKAVGGAIITFADTILLVWQKLLEAYAHMPDILGGGKANGAAKAIAGIRNGLQGIKADLDALPTSKRMDLTARFNKIDPSNVAQFFTTNRGGKDAAAYRSAAEDAGIRLISGGNTRAKGGPVRDGETYLVGEEGPEFLKMRGNGVVTDAAKTRRAMKAGFADSAPSSGYRPTVQSATVVAAPPQTVRVEFDFGGAAENALIELIRKSVKTKGRGNVQVAFGTR